VSVHRRGNRWRVRYRDTAGNQRSRAFDLKGDADRFDTDVRRRAQLGTLGELCAADATLDHYVEHTWAPAHTGHLAAKTRKTYAWHYDALISPRLGSVPLRQLNPEIVARFQADLVAAGTGPQSRKKAMTLLGGILQRAAEARRIPYNPARLVRKAPVPRSPEAIPLAPVAVEALRAVLRPRDAALVSTLAYAGLRPQEGRALRWRDVRERTLVVNAGKTNSRRSVRLLAPLAADLAEWRLRSGRPPEGTPVFPGGDGGPWTAEGFNKWRARVFQPALDEAGLEPTNPYALRHSFASLLAHEGRSAVYIARQLGHGAGVSVGTYQHVLDELEDAPQLPAEEAIRQARESRPSVFGRALRAD
jgi:integrase